MNIHDVARATGFSSATVSRVINKSGYVKEETREKILKVIEENNYIPSAVARSLSIQDTSSIGVIIPDIENSFFAKVIRGISEVAEQNNYNIFFFSTNENPETEHRFLKTVEGQRLKGVIITPTSEIDYVTREYLIRLDKSGVPVVLIDRDINKTEFDGVFTDNIQGSYDAVCELVKAGHKRIAIIAGPETSKPGKDRLKGYKMAINDSGLELVDDYIVRGDFKLEQGYDLTKQLLSLPVPPTAFFTSNNSMTLGCLKYLVENKRELGRDISVLGFDEIETLYYVGFQLSVVDRAVGEMGEKAMNILLDRLNKRGGANEPKRVVLPTKIILRGSEKIKMPKA
ncbi:LacI family DNA-binding transcriptional regulator [Hydrogenoanaerobacterium sp.]|uniref:LacI family DNA-binding transcriptional regulator n=1 Tax=Hydrogenoanaerobacterium sp. TaxID=2953763 RepID=UPI0028997498|nr:LacI family DNA-binding transcriptional regulator [Hydrogenoanaerobacterium sp.]